MSILMDALKQQQPAPQVPSTFWRNVAISLALILATTLGFVAGYMLLASKQSPSDVTQPAALNPEVAQPAGPALIAKTLETKAVEAPVVAATEPEPAAEPERFAPEPQVVTVTANTPQAEPVNEPEISAELRERFASALAETAGNPRSTSNNLTTHSAPAQDIAMLDLTLQRQLPKLRFEAHVFATQPAQRWVKVNGKSLQEGQWITADVRLREITPQYVLLEFGQQLFSMRALSEW